MIERMCDDRPSSQSCITKSSPLLDRSDRTVEWFKWRGDLCFSSSLPGTSNDTFWTNSACDGNFTISQPDNRSLRLDSCLYRCLWRMRLHGAYDIVKVWTRSDKPTIVWLKSHFVLAYFPGGRTYENGALMHRQLFVAASENDESRSKRRANVSTYTSFVWIPRQGRGGQCRWRAPTNHRTNKLTQIGTV